MRALSKEELKSLLPFLKREIEGKHLSSPSLLFDRALFFHLSGKGAKRLVISLENGSPFVSFDDENASFSSSSSPFFEGLKKEFPNPYVDSVDILGEDRIITIETTILNKVYKEEKRTLIIELFPSKPNLLLLNGEGKILLAYRAASLESDRPLMKGLIYEAPKKKNVEKKKEAKFNIDEYLLMAKEEEKRLLSKRKEARFAPILKDLKNKAKRADRKIKAIQNDIDEAKKHLKDNEKGDAIYMCMGEIDRNSSSFAYEGERIELNPAISLSENASRYYKRAKKAKETIERGQENLAKAENELSDAKAALFQIQNADELALEKMLGEKRKEKKKGAEPFGSSSLPYQVTLDGVKILFGKNAKQNDILTFLLMTQKNHLWFHILGTRGPHVIIKSDSPSEKLKKTAAEIAIYEAKKEDGQVMVALRKDIRKGQALGEAILKEYKVIRVAKISDETKKLLESATKMSE